MSKHGRFCLLTALVYFAMVRKSWACGSIGGGADGQLFQNPTLTWTMNPPSAWTYPVSYAKTTQQYFPGQPLTQTDATNQATGDLTAAALEALTNNNIITQSIEIVSNYQPQIVSDCVKVAGTSPIPTQTGVGDIFGIVEQGAVVQLATATAALSVTDCAARKFTSVTLQSYIVEASLTIKGITLSGLQLKQVVAQMQSKLNFNNHVRFVTSITYT